MPAPIEVDDVLAAAALLARELDVGVSAALASTGGLLVLDHVVARVGRPEDGSGAWEGEVVLRPEERSARPPSPGGVQQPRLPERIAALPVRVLEGVGPSWERVLVAAGLRTVGAMAGAGADLLHEVAAGRTRLPLTFAARARGCAVAPVDVPDVLARLRLADLLSEPPVRTHARTGASLVVCAAAWDAASVLCSQLDDAALRLPVAVLRG